MKNTISRILRIVGTIISFFNALFFFAMKPCWSGISSTIGYKGGDNVILFNLPIIICVLFFVIMIADIILKKFFDKIWLHIIFLVVGIVFFGVNMYIVKNGANDYMRFIWPTFFTCVGLLAVIFFLYFLLFIYPKTVLKENKIFKYSMIVAASIAMVLAICNFSINKFTYQPVVYAVEDKYQIVFSTNSEAVAWVEVGGEEFVDSYNGTNKTFEKVHKIEVPMAKLDQAKKYTVHTKRTIYAGPFGGWLGKDLSLTINFKPVDTSDGIQYFSLSDVHMNIKPATKTASFIDNMDFLVLAGDMISVVDSFDDANFANLVAYNITKGEIPVIYARGNHEVKGRYASQLHKFVGAKGESFYYNFYFDNVYGIVLDLGEDHDDGWWEYYGTAYYDAYHDAQVEFLKEENIKKEYDNYDYHLVVCHIPIVFVNNRKNHESIKARFTEELNKMDIDMVITGHQHQIMIFEPGLITPNEELTYNPNYKENKKYKGYLTDFNFPVFMVSKPGFTFDDDTTLTNAKSQIGFYINASLATNKQTGFYLNSKGEKVEVMNMFYDKNYGTEFTIDMVTKSITKK